MKLTHTKLSEFSFQFEKALKFHKIFANDSNNLNAFDQAKQNYLTSSRNISELLAQKSLEVNIFQVLLGLVCNILISFTLLLPTDDTTVKDLRISFKSIVICIVVGILINTIALNEIFDQTNNLKSLLIVALMSVVLRIVVEAMRRKLERVRFQNVAFKTDFLYLLLIGQLFFIISVSSSSFVEEEHQIWYYLCNSTFIMLTFFNYREIELRSVPQVTVKCFAFLLLHIVIRRLNQTGDKWINLPDVADWLHAENNQFWLHALILISLIATTLWLTVVHRARKQMLPCYLIASVLLYLHHTRSIYER